MYQRERGLFIHDTINNNSWFTSYQLSVHRHSSLHYNNYSFRFLCIHGIAELKSLVVFDFVTEKVSWCLVLNKFSPFKGNIWLVFSLQSLLVVPDLFGISIDPAPASWAQVVGVSHPTTYPPKNFPSWIIKATHLVYYCCRLWRWCLPKSKSSKRGGGSTTYN